MEVLGAIWQFSNTYIDVCVLHLKAQYSSAAQKDNF